MIEDMIPSFVTVITVVEPVVLYLSMVVEYSTGNTIPCKVPRISRPCSLTSEGSTL